MNIDFNQTLVTPDHTPALNAQGQPLTLGGAVIQLLNAHVPAGVPDALTAAGLVEQIQKNDPLVTVMFPGTKLLQDAVLANDAKLPALLLAQVARMLGMKGA